MFPVKAGVSQGSVLHPIFLIYISKLLIDIVSTLKLFAGDACFFSIDLDLNNSAKELKQNLKKNLNGQTSGIFPITQI